MLIFNEKPSTLQFNEKRSTQAAARILRQAGGRLPYMMLIKFMYLADREALLRWGTPITGDTYRSMRYGPVLSQTLNLITEEMPDSEVAASFWRQHIQQQGYDVLLVKDPQPDELSAADEKVVDEVFAEFYAKYKELHSDRFMFCEYLHSILPEYKTAERGQAFPLDHHDILVAGRKSAEEIKEVESLLDSVGQMQRVR
jgi:Protein of unknown function (DUF4065)